MPRPTTLAVVCCHAIYLDPSSTQDPHDESSWALASFQKSTAEKPGEHETFLRHLQSGLDLLRLLRCSDEKAAAAPSPPTSNDDHDDASRLEAGDTILVLSGGPTKGSLTPLSEARSYYNAALALPSTSPYAQLARSARSQGRLLLEELATDSYQNVLFSLLLFRRHVGAYPRNVRVITHAFKAPRFLDLHAAALRWPRSRMEVVGIDPPMSSSEHTATVEGERLRGYLPWTVDHHGTRPPLSVKRTERGWSLENLSNLTAMLPENEVKVLLNLLKGREIGGPLPWEY